MASFPLWSWLVLHFGMPGALLVAAALVSTLVSPCLLLLLYWKSVAIDRRVRALYDSLAAQKRQDQVARITYGTERQTRGRRH